MIIQRTDPRFWDVRVVERRIRRGELTRADLEVHLDGLPDVSDHSTPSVPVEEPDLRARERRPMVKVLPPTIGRVGLGSRLDDLDDEIIDDDDEDDDEDDEDDDEDEVEVEA